MLFGKKDRTNSRINTNKGIREERSVPSFSAILIAFVNTIKKPADRIRMSAGAIRIFLCVQSFGRMRRICFNAGSDEAGVGQYGRTVRLSVSERKTASSSAQR